MFMRSALGCAVIATSLLSPLAAQAFDRCDTLLGNRDELREFLIERGVRAAPVKYFDHARSIQIDIDGAGRLIPFTKHDRQGRPVVVYPLGFPPVLCRMALATFLELTGESASLAEAARAAGICMVARGGSPTCITEYARDLEQRYRARFAGLAASEQELAYGIATDALGQVAKHEFAHHFLRHAERIPSLRIAPIDAEFEADFNAILNGAQAGEAPSAMYYFFNVLAEMEHHASALNTPSYESAACRATNVNDITKLFGAVAMLLLDTVEGGGRVTLSDPTLAFRTVAEDLVSKAAPTPSPESCGRLNRIVLREAHFELTRLAALIAEYADYLPRRPGATDLQKGLGLTEPEIFKLIDRLQAMSQDLTHLRGLAARTMSLLVLRVGYGGVSFEVSGQLDRAVQSLAGDILSADYGRLLKVQALNALYHAPDRPLATRLEESGRLFEASVRHLPQAAESWINLAYIALVRGDCEKAAELATESIRWADDERTEDMAKGFRDAVREGSRSGRCAQMAKDFAATLTP
jgi:hypothetical protein